MFSVEHGEHRRCRMLLGKCSFLHVLVKYRKDIGFEVVGQERDTT
jgi:hypothetical protein